MSIDGSRRSLLQSLAVLAGLATTSRWARGAPGSSGNASASSTRPLVARARRAGVFDPATGTLDAAKLDDLLGRAVAKATGDGSPVEACGRLFRSSDVVGIKVSTLGGPGLSPKPELVLRLTRWLQAAGVRPGNIVIWDRTDKELGRAGFALDRDASSVRCFGTNQDYEWTPREWGAGASCFAKLLVDELTALISVGVLKDHDLAGISAGMKNWYGTIHNPNKHHANGCDPYVAHLAAYPLIRRKLRLTVIDGLVGQCHGGPARSPRWAWPWGGVLVSTDPVAIDAVAWREIEARRRELGLKSLTEDQREPRWIATAGRLGLGESSIERIEVSDV
jgi:hypothetical protein